jgi:2-polyprenyl-6-methoxyphenol hydroxylase-like FAD-dependent oxidoreductase
MPVKSEKYHVAICGAGPVGLYLGCRLAGSGLSVLVLETLPAPLPHSRSIGIHPPSISLFDRIGLGEQLISRGVRISRGVAWHDSGRLGTLDFNILPQPHRYVLTVPQFVTETLLESRLEQFSGAIVKRGIRLTGFSTDGKTVYSYAVDDLGVTYTFESRFLIGCDGKNSTVRKHAGIRYTGKSYPDTYIMGDYPDHSPERDTADIYLHSHGLVESFPLPGGLRRWVIKTDQMPDGDLSEELCRLAWQRAGVRLQPESRGMISAFGVQRYLASTMVQKNILLAGDAAHIVSPIGGQGMNLGWMDADDLSDVLPGVIRGTEHPDILNSDNRRRLTAARSAIRRAEFNMSMGRKKRYPFIRNTFARIVLKWPAKYIMAGLFTMRWL